MDNTLSYTMDSTLVDWLIYWDFYNLADWGDDNP